MIKTAQRLIYLNPEYPQLIQASSAPNHKEAELKEKDRLLELAMSRLTCIQREVIERSYLDDEGEFDYISCGEMGISDSTFRREKSGALATLAAALKIEVFKY